MALDLINLGTDVNDGTGDPLREGGQKINDNFEIIDAFTGWGVYNDTVYDTASPFSLSTGAAVALPNNKGSLIESQKPSDITTFYDGSVITGKNGDGLNITIEFRCRPTTGASNVRMNVKLDIGGAVGVIFPRDFTLSKGSGVEHNYLSSFNVYTLNTWEANGATVYVEAFNSAVEIYDIRYLITRTHKAR